MFNKTKQNSGRALGLLLRLTATLGLVLGAMTGCEGFDDELVCEFEGATYEAGEIFSAPDGCNTCTCTDDGDVACTEIACAPPVGLPVEPPLESCSYNGTAYETGESFPAGDGCNTCTCQNEQVICSAAACPPAGEASCTVGDEVYPSGTSGIPAGDGCNTCSCSDGALACTEKACSVGEPGSCDLGLGQVLEMARHKKTCTAAAHAPKANWSAHHVRRRPRAAALRTANCC